MNRLAGEKSPYLLQHKDNPVDWYPWCGEAFEKAKSEDKPVFLSIGYSTCHWCHVMAHESFEDAEVAQVLNDGFVCVKVDREERPDIDAVYMRACQAMTGSGGWPMTVFLTPEQQPFYAGAYFPKHSRYGQAGLMELLDTVIRIWRSDREKLMRSAEQITAMLDGEKEKSGEPNELLLKRAYDALRRSFDAEWGGFGRAPKFPMPHDLLFLMRYGDTEMACKTLRAMAQGGIFDQIGGGFSRYSTDEKWLVPHFEKMLYDNALLIIAYNEAYNLTHDAFFRNIAERTADYIRRELMSPGGGCYSGQDADSEGVEGLYYTFTPDELRRVLGNDEGGEFCRAYGISEKTGIPNRIRPGGEEWSRERLQKLYEYRRGRTSLHTDRKILLSWNAWVMIAFARLGRTDDAIAAEKFIRDNMVGGDGRLYLRFCAGEAACAGQLDDYAVYALALLELYRATFDVSFLEQAIFRAEQMLELFGDEDGGFFLTAHDAERLVTRPKEFYDGAIPSGNSVAAMVLETLAQLTGDIRWLEAADRQMRFAAGQAEEYPSGHCFAMLDVYKALHPGRELIVCGKELPQELCGVRGGELNILFKSEENSQRLARCAPFTEEYPVPEQGTSWYLCENGSCRKAVSNFEELGIAGM